LVDYRFAHLPQYNAPANARCGRVVWR
jgi:hypothetical protein